MCCLCVSIQVDGLTCSPFQCMPSSRSPRRRNRRKVVLCLCAMSPASSPSVWSFASSSSPFPPPPPLPPPPPPPPLPVLFPPFSPIPHDLIGWLKGEYKGSHGCFPADHVVPVICIGEAPRKEAIEVHQMQCCQCLKINSDTSNFC